MTPSDEFKELLRRSGLDLSTLTTVVNTLMRNPILQGIEKSVTISQGAEVGTVRHGLGRLPRGAMVIGISDTDQIPTVKLPTGDGLIEVDINTPAVTDTTVRLYVW